eukprot:6193052-Pleurochrysis_carterae.AAC.3
MGGRRCRNERAGQVDKHGEMTRAQDRLVLRSAHPERNRSRDGREYFCARCSARAQKPAFPSCRASCPNPSRIPSTQSRSRWCQLRCNEVGR